MTRRALVTGVGGPSGHAVAASLVRLGWHVIGTDARVVLSSPAQEVVQVPAAGDPGLLPALRRLVSQYGVELVIPTVRDELPIMAAGRAVLGENITVIVAGPGPVSLAHDKLLTASHLASRGVPTPRFATPSDYRNSAEALADFDGPIVVKSRSAGRGRGVTMVERPDELDWTRLGDDHIVQEFVPGTEYAPMVYRPPAGAHGQGRLVVVLELGRPRPGSDGVDTSPAIVALEPNAADDVERTALAAIRAMGLTGPACVALRRTSAGLPVVLGVSARFGAHTQHAPQIVDAMLASHALARAGRSVQRGRS